MAAYVQHKMSDQEAAGRKLKWPGHNTDCKIAAHRVGNDPSIHHRNQTNQQTLDVPKLPMSTPMRASSGKAKSGMASVYTSRGTRRQSPKQRNDGWEEQQSLLNILSQPSPHRLWSAEGFTGRPELDITVSQSQMLPGTISWTSPRNHIGVHPESLLYHRDPEQLAADVIGLSEKYATLANEHKLQKVQINKLSSSLSRDRAEAAELSEVAEMMGVASPRNRALSPPGSPGRAFRSPCRPQLAREQSGASMPEWVFTDLQQRLNAAQQLLDERSMACNQGQGPGHMAGTWPRARPRSPPARKGSRPVSSHISLDPNSRLADAFAIYGVPRGITQYMSRKWNQPSARGNVVNLTSSMRGRSSLMSHRQLQEKVAAVKKASRVILLEAMQLRAHFPPAVSAQEHAALAPHLDALITLLHTHSIQVQEELGMLPGFNSSQFNPGDSHGKAPNYSSSSPAATSYNQGQPPSRARQADTQQGRAFSPSDYEEDSSFSAAGDGPADEEAAAAAAVEAAVEAAAEYANSSADEEEVQRNTAAAGTAYKSRAAAMEFDMASQDSACLSEEHSRLHAQSPQSHSVTGSTTHAPDAMTKAPEAMTNTPEAMTHMSEDEVQSAPGGDGILDEYRMRMHYSRETPMPGPLSGPTPPLGAPASVSMQRRWSKTNSYPDGSPASQKAWESGVGGSLKRPAIKTPVDVMTYDDDSSGHVAPVSAESADAAFKDACGDSFQRREDVFHPASHVGKSDEASSSELQFSRSSSQQQPSRISDEEEQSGKAASCQLSTADSVVSQVAASPRQLSASGSVLSQIAESTQDQPELDLTESVQSEAASMPKQATAAEQAADSAEDDYNEDFEADELVAEATAVASLPQMMYDNSMGHDESAVEEEQQYMSGSDTAPSHAQLDLSHAPHVATHNGAVKLHYGLEEEEDRLPEHNDASAGDPMTPAAASTQVVMWHPFGTAGDGATTVQWSLDVSRNEPEEEAEEEDSSQGKGRFTKVPSTPFPRKSMFSASENLDEDFGLDEPVAEATAAASLPQMMYDNPVGDDESAGEDDEQQHMEGFATAPSDGVSHAPHVATQLAVSDSGVVKLHCGLEEEEDRVPEQNNASAGDRVTPATVQWSLDVSRDGGEAEEEVSNQGKGSFTKIPSTPFPRRSIFSASGNMADDVDIFEPGDDSASDSAADSDFGGSLNRVPSDMRQDSMGEAGVQLTPSYRQTQDRSLQQAADNEQPFAASWRPQPPQEAAHAAVQEAEAVNLAPKATSQTPSRQSSLVGKPASGDAASGPSTAGRTVPAKQASLNSNEAAAAAVSATLPSRGSAPAQQVGLEKLASGNLSRQPSYVPTPASGNLSKQPSSVPAPASAVSSRRSSFSARIERETSQLLGVGSHQGSDAGSLIMPEADQSPQAVSRTASLSTNQALSPELSSKSLARDSQASSRRVSKRPSFSRPAELSRQSSQISQISRQSSGTTLAAAAGPSAAASWTPSRQPSVSHPAAPASRQFSQVSRQPSMVSTGAAVVASPAASRGVSRQASLTQPTALSSQISRQPSSASTAAPASQMAASGGVSRQASLTQPTALSRQVSQSNQISRQPSSAGTAAPASQMAASRAASRQASLTQPIALSRQASQVSRQPSTASAAAAAAAAPSEMASRVAAGQPSFNRPASASRRQSGSIDPVPFQNVFGLPSQNVFRVPSENVSRVPSRQQSLATRAQPGLGATQEPPALGQGVSQSPSVSRTHSVSSQPRGSNSLEAMHRQMSMPRKATAVDAVAPAAAVRRLSQDNEGRSSFRAIHSRQPSNASVEVDRMLKSILLHNSGIPGKKEETQGSEQALDDMLSSDALSAHDFESSYDHDGRLAAEKHTYLHSQHGMPLEDSVF